VMGRWFTPAFAGDPRAVAVRDRFLRIAPEGYAACCGAIAEMDLRPRLGAIEVPTLIVAGADDPATPVAMAEQLRQGIRGAEMVVLPRAAHLFLVERADALEPHLATFLDRHRGLSVPGPADLVAGLANRGAVLGAEHVARSLETAGPFGAPWQEFLTRYAWGEAWGDPALPWKTRSMLTLAMMAALHREEEFKLHLRAARGNGVTLDELRAILMHCAVYAGVPAANAAFRWARDALGEELGHTG
jgi:3-oxoadipate enol-lactonase / 4-carboxymuconolactone decarboxylase